MSSPWPDAFQAPEKACWSECRTPALAQGMVCSHLIDLTKCTWEAWETLSFEVNQETEIRTLERGGKSCQTQVICQHFSSLKCFWWEIFSKICLIKANVSQRYLFFDAALSRKDTHATFRCGSLFCQNNKKLKTSRNQSSRNSSTIGNCSNKQSGKLLHTHSQNLPSGWTPPKSFAFVPKKIKFNLPYPNHST